MKKEKLRKIIWHDAASCRAEGKEWLDKEEVLKIAKEKYAGVSLTGGIILENNKNYIVIASTKSDDLYSDITMIPKKFLIKIT